MPPVRRALDPRLFGLLSASLAMVESVERVGAQTMIAIYGPVFLMLLTAAPPSRRIFYGAATYLGRQPSKPNAVEKNAPFECGK